MGMELRRSVGGGAGRRMEKIAGASHGAGLILAFGFPRGEPRGYVPASPRDWWGRCCRRRMCLRGLPRRGGVGGVGA